jgi:hypothetical protein
VVAAVGVAFLRLPAVAGFMLADAVSWPSGLALIKDQHAIEVLSEIGVILLLFTIGLEFSLERLKRIGRLVAIGGSLQVGLTTIACVVAELMALGATDVVAEEIDGGVETLARVLRLGGTPINVLGALVRKACETTDDSARRTVFPRHKKGELSALDALKVESILLQPGMAGIGKSFSDLRLRTTTGALIVAVQRDGALLEHLDPLMKMKEGDVLFVVGARESVYAALRLLDAREGVTPIGHTPEDSY